MGLIDKLLGLIFGNGRNVVVETAEVFRENTEAAAKRQSDARGAALDQFGSEFAHKECGPFDRFMNGLNRVPRPALALGTLGLFIAAMIDPVWFSARMQGIALVPEPLWWLLGVIVSFYFGARHQFKGQEFQRSIAETLARTPQVTRNIGVLREMRHDSVRVADPGSDAELVLDLPEAAVDDNPPLRELHARMPGGPGDR